MHKAPTSGAHGTAEADIEANAASFTRHLRAANKTPNTIKSYMEAVTQLDAYLAAHGLPRTSPQSTASMSRRSSRTSWHG